ncbi:MAG: hypothetical protein HRT69_16495 [Flavobacteriaceae bacterium]|nr:hypothetical protein [Flavobacteriaceae bacterium]
MSSINWNELAAKAEQQTDTQFATQIASLTSMSTTEISTFIQESTISNANALKVLQEVNNAASANTQKATAISNIENGVGFLISIVSKIV